MRRKGTELSNLKSKIKELWQNDVPLQEIADQLGIVRTTVCYHAKQMRLASRNPRIVVSQTGTVVCRSCQKALPSDSFYKRSAGTLMGVCKRCSNQKSMQWREERKRKSELMDSALVESNCPSPKIYCLAQSANG